MSENFRLSRENHENIEQVSEELRNISRFLQQLIQFTTAQPNSKNFATFIIEASGGDPKLYIRSRRGSTFTRKFKTFDDT